MSTEAKTEGKTYHGSCHCGAIKYTVSNIEVSEKTLSKCNCSICHKTNYVYIGLEPEKFKLESPVSLDDVDGQYQFGAKGGTHYFCKTCGIRTFFNGYGMFGLNAVTLDDADLSTIKIKKYSNGKEDDWKTTKETPFPGGSY